MTSVFSITMDFLEGLIENTSVKTDYYQSDTWMIVLALHADNGLKFSVRNPMNVEEVALLSYISECTSVRSQIKNWLSGLMPAFNSLHSLKSDTPLDETSLNILSGLIDEAKRIIVEKVPNTIQTYGDSLDPVSITAQYVHDYMNSVGFTTPIPSGVKKQRDVFSITRAVVGDDPFKIIRKAGGSINVSGVMPVRSLALVNALSYMDERSVHNHVLNNMIGQLQEVNQKLERLEAENAEIKQTSSKNEKLITPRDVELIRAFIAELKGRRTFLTKGVSTGHVRAFVATMKNYISPQLQPTLDDIMQFAKLSAVFLMRIRNDDKQNFGPKINYILNKYMTLLKRKNLMSTKDIWIQYLTALADRFA